MPTFKFETSSPQKVLKQAQQFKESISNAYTLPTNNNKSIMYVQKIADYDLNSIKYSVHRAQYQNSLFRKLQEIDIQNRKKASQSLLLRDNKVEKILDKNHQVQQKKHQVYNKHVGEVHKRYREEQVKKFQQEKQEALKLRKQIKEFYQKQEHRKKLAQEKQIKVPTCYSNALERIHKIQKTNEEFAEKSEIQLQKSFLRSSPEKRMDYIKMRTSSLDFRKNEAIYQQSSHIFKQNQAKFVQKFAKNQTSSLKAFEHKFEENQKAKKRIREKLKKDHERWLTEKKKVDQKKTQIPEKCTERIQRTLQSTFRHTFSTFKDSFSRWRTTVELNRSLIKQKEDKRKDEIIGIHQDLTIRNRSIKEIDSRMLSMKQRASKVAVDFF